MGDKFLYVLCRPVFDPSRLCVVNRRYIGVVSSGDGGEQLPNSTATLPAIIINPKRFTNPPYLFKLFLLPFPELGRYIVIGISAILEHAGHTGELRK